MANLYRSKFALAGFEVETVPDGEAGLNAIRNFQPDAVVLDLMLPKISGVDLMRKVRAEREFAQMPIIVLSNTYLTNTVQAAWKAGATKCLSKACCTPKQIIEIVKHALAADGSNPASRDTGPAAPPVTWASANADAESQAEWRRSFISSLPATLAALRTQLQGLIKAQNEAARLERLREMCGRIHALSGNGGVAGLLLIAQMAEALEALLEELIEKPGTINLSTLRTVALAIDFLGVLFNKGLHPDHQRLPSGNVLVVDDEALSRRAITHALDRAELKSVAVEDPQAAYDLLAQKEFDLIFLDIDMPKMSGSSSAASCGACPPTSGRRWYSLPA